MHIKIYPECGDAYIVITPDSVGTPEEIDNWIAENLLGVQFWEYNF